MEIPLGVCVTTAGFRSQLLDHPDLEKLIDLVDQKSSELCCLRADEAKAKARKDLEDACNRYIKLLI